MANGQDKDNEGFCDKVKHLATYLFETLTVYVAKHAKITVSGSQTCFAKARAFASIVLAQHHKGEPLCAFVVSEDYASLLFLLISKTSLTYAQPVIERVGPALTHPWGMDFLSQTELLVTTRPGALYHVDLTTGAHSEITNLPEVAHWEQGGLLNVAVKGDEIFLCYAKLQAGGAVTAIDRARLVNRSLRGRMTIFMANQPSASAHHFGCRLAIQDDMIYASLGDRGRRHLAQDPAIHDGSVICLHLDGRLALYYHSPFRL